MSDLLNPAKFEEKVRLNVEEKNFLLTRFLSADPVDADDIIKRFSVYRERIAPYITDVSVFVNAGIRAGRQILFEGAQGTHLDIDHGTYPYVTSSNTISGNACCGAGVGPGQISGVTGIVKAYTTRVGEGPFPTELFDEVGDQIQKNGAEFGATTGRKRRCGWLDMVLLRNAARLNGLTGTVITKLDVLSGLDPLKICIQYLYNDSEVVDFPADLDVLAECRPVYITLPGWHEDISGVRSFEDLPENTKNYLLRIEELMETPIEMISVGPGREETIMVKNPYA
jgi:adenylosuccinate synthase